MGPLRLEVMDSAARAGVSIKDIPSYIPPSQLGAQARKPTKNQRYQIRMSTILQGMVCTYDIVLVLMQMKYKDHDFLTLEDVVNEPYVLVVTIGGGTRKQIPHH